MVFSFVNIAFLFFQGVRLHILWKEAQDLEKTKEKLMTWPYFSSETVLKSAMEYGKLKCRFAKVMKLCDFNIEMTF
jgi:hypothetical protein